MKFPIIRTNQEFDEHFRSKVWVNLAKRICRRHGISFDVLKRSEHGENVVFLIDDSFVIKIYTPFRSGFEREKISLEFARGKTSLKIPEIVQTGEIERFKYIVTTQLSGGLLTREVWQTLAKKEQIEIITKLADGLKELHSHDANSISFDWHSFLREQTETVVARQKNHGANAEWIEALPDYLKANLKLLPKDSTSVFLHGDVHFGNLRFQKLNGNWQISGLFDFADSLCGFREYEFVAIGVLMIQGQADVQREFFKAYGYAEKDIDETLRKRLMLLTILYECSDLRKYAMRLKPEALSFSLEELEKGIWSF